MRRGMILATMALALHCGGEDTEGPTLDVVADQITFKSVETLGTHHMLATVRQETEWADGGVESHEETVELAWNDWDSFHLRRVVRGATAAETIVHQAKAYHRAKGPTWAQEADAEPARLRVRTSWRVWDTAMEVFSGRVKLTEAEQSVVDGRPAKRYKISLAPLKDGARINSGALVPKQISGEVWLDETTAVRLSADVTATVAHKGMTRTITLHLRRGSIGQTQTIAAPKSTAEAPADVQRARMRGRRTPDGRSTRKEGNP